MKPSSSRSRREFLKSGLAGTSAVVYPCAAIPVNAKQNGAAMMVFDLQETVLTKAADVFVQGPAGTTLPALIDQLKAL